MQMITVVIIAAASVAVGTINNIDNDFRNEIINKDEDDRNEIINEVFPSTPHLVDHSRAACGWIIGVCAAVTLYQVLVILLRFLNIGLINRWITIFLDGVRQY